MTAEGGARGPSAGALKRRLVSLREQVKGTPLDTDKTRSQLRQIAKVLSGEFGKVGRDVRQAILGMFNDISGALDSGKDSILPRTAFQVARVGDIIGDLGLDPVERRALKQRLARLGPGGTIPGAGTGLGGAFGMDVGPVVQNEIHVFVGGHEVSDVVIRETNKRIRRGSGRRSGQRATARSG